MSLYGKRVLLTAYTPHDDQDREGVLETEEAVASFVRAAIAAGGTVDFIGDPALALLASVAAAEYFLPAPAEGAERESRTRSTALRLFLRENAASDMEDLRTLGIVEVVPIGGREVDLVSQLAAGCAGLILVGGGAIADLFAAFRQRNLAAPVFAFGSSSRDARRLHERFDIPLLDLAIGAEPPPRSTRPGMRDVKRGPGEEERYEPVDIEFRFAPVALASQEIVRAITERYEKPPDVLLS